MFPSRVFTDGGTEMSHVQSGGHLLDQTSKDGAVKSLTASPCLSEPSSAIGDLTSSLESTNASSNVTKPTNTTQYGLSGTTKTQTAMEHRWNHDIPTQYFTDPQYNAGYAPSRMRHDSGNSTSSSRCSNSLYSSYPSRSYTEASPPDLDPIRYSNEADSYYSPFYSSPLSNSPHRSTSPTRHNPIPALYTSPLTLPP